MTKRLQKEITPAKFFLADKLKTEKAMTDIVSEILSNYKKASEKKREISSDFDSIWDCVEYTYPNTFSPSITINEVKCNDDVTLQREHSYFGSVNNVAPQLSNFKTAEPKVLSNDISEEITLYSKNDSSRIPLKMRKTHIENNCARIETPDLSNKFIRTSNAEENKNMRFSNSGVETTSSKEIPMEYGDSCVSSSRKMMDPKGFESRNKIFPKKRDGLKDKSIKEWLKERFTNEEAKQPLKELPASGNNSPSNAFQKNKVKSKLNECEIDYFYGIVSEGATDEMLDERYDSCEDDDLTMEGNENSSLSLTSFQQAESGAKLYSVFDVLENSGMQLKTNGMHKNFGLCLRRETKYPFNNQSRNISRIKLQVIGDDNEIKGEIEVLNEDICDVYERYPFIYNILPGPGMNKSVSHSADAVMILLRCLFDHSITLPDWETTLEVYALAKRHKVQNLEEFCESYFKEKIVDEEQIYKVFQVSNHFGIPEILHSLWCVKPKTVSILQTNSSRKYLSSVYSKIIYKRSEFCIPLSSFQERGLGNLTPTDIENKITIEVVQGAFKVKGLEIGLQTNSQAVKLFLFCTVLKNGKKILDFERTENLSPYITLDFQSDITLKHQEQLKISLSCENLSPRCCSCLESEKVTAGSGKFKMKFESAKKTDSKKLLFFISKVYYTVIH